jgi:hypothetical protein
MPPSASPSSPQTSALSCPGKSYVDHYCAEEIDHVLVMRDVTRWARLRQVELALYVLCYVQGRTPSCPAFV